MRSVLAIVLVVVTATVHAGALSDPTQPVGFGARRAAPAPVPAGPVLQSTMVSPDRKVAVISGKTVKVGDTFDGAVVTDIKPYEVRMTRGGRETTLRMLPKLVKEKGTVE
ncbi:MAG: hypothetical protein ACJ8J7_04155 [Sulfurifustaceae bacterium]